MTDTSFPPLKREPLFEEELPGANPAVHLIKGARIRFAPGQPTGLHRHPVSTVGVVTAGSFNFQLEGKSAWLLKTGDSFFEPAGHTILQFDNASTNEPAEIVCFYLADTKERPAIEDARRRHGQPIGQKMTWRWTQHIACGGCYRSI
jgi:quercetin dioxygenase-like cupin family protein